MATMGAAFCVYSQNKALYGFASKGGSANNGVFFSYNLGSQNFSVKKHFTIPTEGLVPRAGFMKGSNGKLYGTTFAGGANNVGTIFEYNPSSETYSVLANFGGASGMLPSGNIIQATNNKLYGMASKGGSGDGTLWEYDLSTNTFEVKVNLMGYNGSNASGGLIEAANGKLYGMTPFSSMANNNQGVLFEYDIATNAYTVKFAFDGTNGGRPYGDLIEVGGKLYGMTTIGGTNNAGIIFEFDPSTGTLTKKFDFGGSNGRNPMGTLLLANNGKLYGMASGGASNNGLIFEYDAATNAFAVKANFNMDNGFNPQGSLMQASDGKLYGLASYGGVIDDYNYEYGEGTMFSYDIATNTITKLLDFDGTNGSTPYYTTLIEVETSSLSTTDVAASAVQVYPNPVEDILHIKGSRNAQVSVYTMAGQQVFTGAATNGQVNLSSLSKGVYIVKIEADGNVSTHKIVKK